MNDFGQHMVKFDAYLNSEMSKEERLRFEQELNSDLVLTQEFEAHKKFLVDFNEGVNYRETKKNLKSIHKSIYYPDENFFFSRKFYIPLAVAASFVFILLIFNPVIREGSTANSVGHDEELAYAESTDSIKSQDDSYAPSVTELLDTLLADNGNTEIKIVDNISPSGTAFMISNDGYFLTAKHLLEGNKVVHLQQKNEKMTFEVEVVYVDPVEDFAILKCAPNVAQSFKEIPYRFIKNQPHIPQAVFTLGYPKNELQYTLGELNSKNGYFLDSLNFKSPSANLPEYSGAPLFSYNGDLIGIINSTKSDPKSVTYFVNHHYIQNVLETLKVSDSIYINMSLNYNLRPKKHDDFIKSYAPYIFEIHP